MDAQMDLCGHFGFFAVHTHTFDKNFKAWMKSNDNPLTVQQRVRLAFTHSTRVWLEVTFLFLSSSLSTLHIIQTVLNQRGRHTRARLDRTKPFRCERALKDSTTLTAFILINTKIGAAPTGMCLQGWEDIFATGAVLSHLHLHQDVDCRHWQGIMVLFLYFRPPPHWTLSSRMYYFMV